MNVTVVFNDVKNQVFIYKDKPYMKVIPAKSLFNSTMIHEVVTRGDFFAVSLGDQKLTVLPNGADRIAPKSATEIVRDILDGKI